MAHGPVTKGRQLEWLSAPTQNGVLCRYVLMLEPSSFFSYDAEWPVWSGSSGASSVLDLANTWAQPSTKWRTGLHQGAP